MESTRNLLIAVDAAHGGMDSGAVDNGRLEKNDNLALASNLQKDLNANGFDVVMTRIDDRDVSPQERIDLANEANADLLISLHRGSTEETPDGGMQVIIFRAAPDDTTLVAAQNILEELRNAGLPVADTVQRGNYQILRRTTMPAILIGVGAIDSEEDNRLFDTEQEKIADAIVRGVQKYYGVSPAVQETPSPARWSLPVMPTQPVRSAPPPVMPGSSPLTTPHITAPPSKSTAPEAPAKQGIGETRVAQAQKALKQKYGFTLPCNGLRDKECLRAAVMALQSEINLIQGKRLPIDGILGKATLAALPTIVPGSPAGYIFLIQILLMLFGYDVGAIDGVNGPGTRTAIQLFQRDHYMAPNGMVEPNMLRKLLNPA
jgi:peptidoglycan hydrolase-like protein with peptidoglycan-binding domain